MAFYASTLTSRLRNATSSGVFQRGQQLHASGAVDTESIQTENQASHEIFVSAEVRGSTGSHYDSSLVFDLKEGMFFDMDCSCPYGEDCKHAIALALECIERYRNTVRTFRSEHISLEPESVAQAIIQSFGESAHGKVRDAEIEDDGASKTLTADEMLAAHLKSLGIRPENLPKHIVDTLLLKMRPPEQPHSDIADTYRVVLVQRYRSAPKVLLLRQGERYTPYSYYYSEVASVRETAQEILDKYDTSLTPEQHELFGLLTKKYSTDKAFDWIRFFNLLHTSGIPAKFSSEAENAKEIPLQFTVSPEKIDVQFFLGKHPHPLYEEEELALLIDTRKIFEQDDEECQAFFGKGRMIILHDANVSLHALPDILTRTLQASYRHGTNGWDDDRFLFPMSEDIYPNAANLLSNAKPYCKIDPKISKDFSVKKFDRAQPKFLIDYDIETAEMTLRAVIDYGLRYTDIRRITKVRQYGTGLSRFERKVRDKHAPQERFVPHVSTQMLAYAPIRRKKEKSLAALLLDNPKYGFNRRLECARKGNDQIFSFVKENLPHLEALGYPIEFTRDKFQFFEEDFRADIQVDADTENDWLAFDAEFYLGKDKVSLEDLQKYLQNKEKFLRIGGKILAITNREELERLAAMLEHFRQAENRFEGRLYHAQEAKYIFTESPYYTAKFSSGVKKFLKEAESGRPVRAVKKPAPIQKTLRDYQLDGVDWLHFLKKYHFAGILADDMGLGKTLQALSMIHMHRAKGKPSLIVCPKTLLYNWQEETGKFFPDMRVLVLDMSPKERRKLMRQAADFDIIVTSYHIVQRDREMFKSKNMRFRYCILDEAQNIKNHKTKNAQFIKEVNADYRVALTGTPLENTVSEIWSIFDFLMPGFLGNYSHFSKRFLKPIMKENNVQALRDLNKKTECFMLRRTKGEVLKELPAKIEQVTSCRLGKDQNVLYQEVLASVKSEIFGAVKEKGFARSQIHILAGLMKLRQACNHPAILLKKKRHDRYESAKLELFLELLDEITKEKSKVLVFSQFTMMLDILEKEVKKRGHGYSYLSGKTRNRQALVNDFNTDPEKRVFLISLKAGGTGLNLTSAEHVIIFDPWWNPSVENQAIDRAHRIGQTRSVHVHRLITRGTIEERILALQKRKQFLFDNIVGESKDMFKHLTWGDVKNLFSDNSFSGDGK